MTAAARKGKGERGREGERGKQKARGKLLFSTIHHLRRAGSAGSAQLRVGEVTLALSPQ